MLNKINKGRRNELLAKKLLEKQGYIVEKKNASRWQSNDFWGMFDLLALKSHETRLIQIKSNRSHFTKAKKEIQEWVNNRKIYGEITFEIWLKLPRKDWICETIKANKEVFI